MTLRVPPVVAANDPVGTVVTTHTGGMSWAQRFGSILTTLYSHGFAPLPFGFPAGGAIERLAVRWPDGTLEEPVVASGEKLIELIR